MNNTHSRVARALDARLKMSQRAMSQRYSNWQRADEDFRGFTPESVEDSRRKAERTKGTLHYTTITVPQTYATALTAHTYWSSIFFNRSPIFQLGIRKGEVEKSVDAMEALVDYQVFVGKMLVPLMIWLMDPCRYGFGVVRSYWDKQVKRVAQLVEVPISEGEIGIPGRSRIEKQVLELEGYRGNRIYNVRPYQWFPDTRVPLVDYQKGEFCADTTYRSFQSLKAAGTYFNMDALGDVRGGEPMQIDETGSGQIQLPDVSNKVMSEEPDLDDKGTVHVANITVSLIPKDWGLGPETMPEKWNFELGENKIIIGAEPFGHIHDEYPYDVIFYEVEGYALDVRGMLEIGRELNTATSWLLNSHMFNVRRALNDQLVVDPSRIVMKDLLDGGPGKLIRLKPAAYGTGTQNAVTQLQIQDITRANVSDMQVLNQIMQQVLGVNDNVMGQLDPGGRKTATEVRTASTFSISRLKLIAEFFSATGFGPLSQKLVSNTQQFYFAEASELNPPKEAFRAVGEMLRDMQTVDVTPEAIAGFYDYVPVDGTLPIDRIAQANIWKEILQVVAPLGYDIDEMVNWIASLSGVRGLKRFKLEVRPDAQVADQRQRGNLVPIGGSNG